MSPRNLRYYQMGENLTYMTDPQLSLNLSAESIIARKKFSFFFENQLQSSLVVYLDEETDNIYEADHQLRRKVWLPQLTCARFQCSTPNKKIFFGKPDDLLIIEHLAANLKLSDLQELFYSAIDQYKQSRVNYSPCSQPIDLHQRLVEICESKWQPLNDYQATLIRKVTRMYDNSALLTNIKNVDMIKQNAMEGAHLPEFTEIFNRKYEDIESSIEIILEKCAILTQLFSRDFYLYLTSIANHKLQSIMWDGSFKECGNLLEIYKVRNEPYRKILQDLFDSEQNRYKEMPASGRLFVESLDEMHQRFDMKFQRLEKQGYRFVANPQRERLMVLKTGQLLLNQIIQNINERKEKGIDQTETIVLLKSLANQDDQQDNITQLKAEKLFQELLVEANAQLGILTLPESLFGQYKELIKITQYEAMKKIDFDGKDPRTALKLEEISLQTQAELKIYTQMSDGSVPSFEQFQAVKEKLTSKTKTPLTVHEERDQTLRQYLQLQQHVTDKSLPQVRALQSQLPQENLPPSLRLDKSQSNLFLSPDGSKLQKSEEMIPSQSFVLDSKGNPATLPFDIVDKSVAELKDLGFSEVMSLDFKPNKRSGKLEPNVTASDRQKMMQALEIDENGQEIIEEDFFTDYLQDQIDDDSSKKESQLLIAKLKAQQQIDEKKIAIVYQALQNGIELKGNKLYLEMLDHYPIFERKLVQRKQQLKQVKKQSKPVSSSQNLETTTVDQRAYEKYEKMLKQYELEQDELTKKFNEIPPDVITEADQEAAIKADLRQEERIEQKLGSKFIVTEFDSASSSLDRVNKEINAQNMIDTFLDDVQTQFSNQ